MKFECITILHDFAISFEPKGAGYAGRLFSSAVAKNGPVARKVSASFPFVPSTHCVQLIIHAPIHPCAIHSTAT